MQFSKIFNNLFVGSCPVSRRDVESLRDAGITAVLNLQTEDDFAYWRLNWEELWNAYDEFRIRVYRYPIRDFDIGHLRQRLDSGVELLDDLLPEQVVYLHCSAGINRSPTLAIAYMMKKMNMNVYEAASRFRERHYCEPYIEALQKK